MKKINYDLTHAVLLCDTTIIAQFRAEDDKSAAIQGRVIRKRHIAETSGRDIPLKKEDFRLIHKQYKTFYK